MITTTMHNSQVYSSILKNQEALVTRLQKTKEVNQDLANKQREEAIMKQLKDVAENSGDIQSNHTPMEICNMMLEKVDLEKAQSVLVLYNVELLFAFRKAKYQGQVTFFTQSLAKKEWAQKLLPGVVVEYIDKEENPLYFMENQWPDKFDIVIANPPYSKKLDLKFLDKAFDISKKEVVFVHPSSFIVDRKKVTKIYKEIRNKIKESLKSILLFNGNPEFGIELQLPCMITHIDKSHTGKIDFENLIYHQKEKIQSEQIEDISIFGFDERFTSIEKKVKDHIRDFGSLQDITKFGEPTGKSFYLNFSNFNGRAKKNSTSRKDVLYKNDFFVMVSKNQIDNILEGETDKLRYKISIGFDTKIEMSNFQKYIKSDFFRSSLALSKTNQHLDTRELCTVPLLDFNQEWTDEKLYAHFNITEEEQAFIKEVIPPYYD